MQQEVNVRDLGVIEYGEAWRFQDSLLLENTAKKIKLAKGEHAGETIHHLLFWTVRIHCDHAPCALFRDESCLDSSLTCVLEDHM